MSVVKSLPEDPLTEDVISALDSSTSTDFCESIVGRRTDDQTTPPTDAVVAFWLATDKNTFLLGYSPETEAWERIDEFVWDELDVENYLEQSTDTLLDWLDEYYAPEDLAFITDTESDDQVEAHLLDILSSTTVSQADVEELMQIPALEHTESIATIAGKEDVVLFSAALFDTVYVLGFDASTPENLIEEKKTSTGDWTTYTKATIDDDVDPADSDPDISESIERLEDQYGSENINILIE